MYVSNVFPIAGVVKQSEARSCDRSVFGAQRKVVAGNHAAVVTAKFGILYGNGEQYRLSVRLNCALEIIRISAFNHLERELPQTVARSSAGKQAIVSLYLSTFYDVVDLNALRVDERNILGLEYGVRRRYAYYYVDRIGSCVSFLEGQLAVGYVFLREGVGLLGNLAELLVEICAQGIRNIERNACNHRRVLAYYFLQSAVDRVEFLLNSLKVYLQAFSLAALHPSLYDREACVEGCKSGLLVVDLRLDVLYRRLSGLSQVESLGSVGLCSLCSRLSGVGGISCALLGILDSLVQSALCVVNGVGQLFFGCAVADSGVELRLKVAYLAEGVVSQLLSLVGSSLCGVGGLLCSLGSLLGLLRVACGCVGCS